MTNVTVSLERVDGSMLKLADIVRLPGVEAFPDAIVHRLSDDTVWLRRPYMAHEDWSHTGGVITTIGLEDFQCSRHAPFFIVRRGPGLR